MQINDSNPELKQLNICDFSHQVTSILKDHQQGFEVEEDPKPNGIQLKPEGDTLQLSTGFAFKLGQESDNFVAN